MNCPKCSNTNTVLFDYDNQMRCADCGLTQCITHWGNPNPDKSWSERMFLGESNVSWIIDEVDDINKPSIESLLESHTKPSRPSEIQSDCSGGKTPKKEINRSERGLK